MSLLNIEAVSKTFGGLQALANVNMTVEEGELRGIIGPNGAGKTTLLNVITGSLPLTSGKIKFEGMDISYLPMHKRASLGIVRTFQIPQLFNNMTVLENVKVGCHIHFRTEMLSPVLRNKLYYEEEEQITQRAQAMIEYVGLGGRENELAGNLAYGHQRLLELARALAARPKLLLLDEPVAGLNPSEKEQFTALLKEINKKVTIIIIEHDMKTIMNLCQQVTVLNLGTKLTEGPPVEIQQDPAVIASYLGEEG